VAEVVILDLKDMRPHGRISFRLDGRPEPLELDVDEYVRVREWLMSIPHFQKPFTARMAAVLHICYPTLRLRDIVAIDRYICQLSGLTFRLTEERKEREVVEVDIEPDRGDPYVVS